MIRNLLILFILTFGSIAASGQTVHPSEFLSGLSASDASGARIRVDLNGNLDQILNRPHSLDQQTVEGYRVYIFNDNSQFARSQAMQTRDRFRGLFPDIPVEVIYNPPPYYKVAVGYCLSKDEVVMIFGRIKTQFPAAFIPNKERLELKHFLQANRIEESVGEE